MEAKQILEVLNLVDTPATIALGTYFAWRFITCFMVFLKSLHAHTAFVTARAMQAHGYTTDGELADLKQMADVGGSVASAAVKWFTLAVLFLTCAIAGF
ncbi:hypothetical protein VPHK469_0070 [Vibrio phage K469]